MPRPDEPSPPAAAGSVWLRGFTSRARSAARAFSTVLGVLVHAGEHTARHVGQLITTMTIVRGLGIAREGGPTSSNVSRDAPGASG